MRVSVQFTVITSSDCLDAITRMDVSLDGIVHITSINSFDIHRYTDLNPFSDGSSVHGIRGGGGDDGDEEPISPLLHLKVSIQEIIYLGGGSASPTLPLALPLLAASCITHDSASTGISVSSGGGDSCILFYTDSDADFNDSNIAAATASQLSVLFPRAVRAAGGMIVESRKMCISSSI